MILIQYCFSPRYNERALASMNLEQDESKFLPMTSRVAWFGSECNFQKLHRRGWQF